MTKQEKEMWRLWKAYQSTSKEFRKSVSFVDYALGKYNVGANNG